MSENCTALDSRLDRIADDKRPVLAVDLDDVLAATHLVAAQWHNETYGTDMKLSDFYYYHWWRNPFWGPPDEAIAKTKDLYASGRPYHAPPVEGAEEGVRTLHELGYRLIIVTAREKYEMDETRAWLDEHFHGYFDDVICVGMPMDSEGIDSDGKEVSTHLGKSEVCQRIGAIALVDDAREHALACAAATPPVLVLLFGEGEWSKRRSIVRGSRPPNVRSDDIKEGKDAGVDVSRMGFDERLRYEGGQEFWKDDERLEESQIPEGAPVNRTSDWAAVVDWARKQLETNRSWRMMSNMSRQIKK